MTSSRSSGHAVSDSRQRTSAAGRRSVQMISDTRNFGRSRARSLEIADTLARGVDSRISPSRSGGGSSRNRRRRTGHGARNPQPRSWAPTAVATMPAAIFATALLGSGSSPELSTWFPSGMPRHQKTNRMLAAPSSGARSGNPRSISMWRMRQGARLTLERPPGSAGLGASTVRTHQQARQVRPRAPP